MLHDSGTVGAKVGGFDGFIVGTGANGVTVGLFVTGVSVGGAVVGPWMGANVGDFVGGILTIRNDNFSTDPIVPFTRLPSYVVTVRLC